MKKAITVNVLLLLFIIILGSIPFFADAQKLPNVQKISVRAPDSIKIDGKTTEWNDIFQAHNLVSRIFYTLSNDDNYLYLTACMEDQPGNDKILNGGITFTVTLPAEKGDDKSKKQDIAITYPIEVFTSRTGGIKTTLNIAEGYLNDTKNPDQRKADSVNIIANRRMGNLFKEIRVTGIPEIQEPLISVYNAEGIKVAAQFNSHILYVYELAISLKYLGNSIISGEKFRYNIKLNGIPAVAGNGIPTPRIPVIYANDQRSSDLAYEGYPTDFWGEYSLAKK